jgi:hypothetical protein
VVSLLEATKTIYCFSTCLLYKTINFRNSLAWNPFIPAKSLGEMPIKAVKKKNAVVNKWKWNSYGRTDVVHVSVLKNTKAFVIEIPVESQV